MLSPYSGILVILGTVGGQFYFHGRSWGDVASVHSQEEGTGSTQQNRQVWTRGARERERKDLFRSYGGDLLHSQ